MTARQTIVPLAVGANSTTVLRPYRGEHGLPGRCIAVVGFQCQTYDNAGEVSFATERGASYGSAHIVGYQPMYLYIPINTDGLVVRTTVKTTLLLEYIP